MSIGGIIIRFGSLFLRFLQLCVSAIGLGIFSYFLAVLAHHNFHIADRWRAVEGLTGASTLYTLFGVLLTLCLGGNIFFGYLAVLLDILFIGAWIAVAYFTRDGTHSCSAGNVITPLGSTVNPLAATGQGGAASYTPDLHYACILNRVVFAVSIVAILLFLITAVWQIMMVQHHQKEKRYGPSPANDYTSGTGRRSMWKRNKRTKDVETTGTIPATTAAYPAGTAVRPSHETGTTLGNNNYASEPKYGEQGYGVPAHGTYQEPAYAAPATNGTYHDRTTF